MQKTGDKAVRRLAIAAVFMAMNIVLKIGRAHV